MTIQLAITISTDLSVFVIWNGYLVLVIAIIYLLINVTNRICSHYKAYSLPKNMPLTGLNVNVEIIC